MNDYRVTFEVRAPGARKRDTAEVFPKAVTKFSATYQAADDLMDRGWKIVRHIATEMRTDSGAWLSLIVAPCDPDVPAPS